MNQRHVFRASITLTVLIYICLGKANLHDFLSNKTYEITVYDAFVWGMADELKELYPENKNIESLPIVRIDQKYKDFDLCNDDTFTPEAIEPLLDNISNITGVGYENGWVALVEIIETIPTVCEGITPIHVLNPAYVAISAQKLGASGVMYLSQRTEGEGTGIAGLEIAATPPNVDNIKHEVNSEKIVIPVLSIETLQYIGGKLLDINSKSYQWTMLPPVKFDWNPYGPLFEMFGLYRIVWAISGILSAGLALFIIMFCQNLIEYFRNKKDQASIVAKQMRFMILIPELINTIIRTAICIDPFGGFHYFDFFTGRILFNLSNSLSTFTDVVMVIYCFDVYNVYKASRTTRSGSDTSTVTGKKPFIIQYKKGSIFVLTFAFLMISVDQIVLYYGLWGYSGSSDILLPVLYMLTVNLVVIVILVRMSFLMKGEVQHVLKDLSEDLTDNITIGKIDKAVVDGRTTGATAIVLQKSQLFLRMRNYMLWAAFGRLLSVIAFGLIGSNWYYYSAFNFGFSVALIGAASVFSSFAQILAALQLPHSSKTKVDVFGTTNGRLESGSKTSKDRQLNPGADENVARKARTANV